MSDARSDMPSPLRAWIDEQPDADGDELERTWALSTLARGEEPAAEEVDTAWQAVDAVLDARGGRRARDRWHRHRSRRRSTLRWAGVAALALALFGVGLWLWMRPVEITVPPGRTASVTLPDGSTVALGSDSRLTYRRGLFGWDRAVRLEGEAFFDVVEGERPFTVTTFNARVEVLGTRFNVRARVDAPTRATTLTLESGRVRFSARGAPQRAVMLQPGQQSRVVGNANTPALPYAVNLETALAWRTGGLAFSAAPLRIILDEIERRFDVDIRLEAPALRSDSLSLFLPEAKSAQGVLRDLCASLGCRVRRVPGGFGLYAKEDAL